MSWGCNASHVLTLRCSDNKKNGDGWKTGKSTISSNYTRGKVIDIPIKEYLTESRQFKNFYKQFSVGVEFPKQDTEIDPYIYGLWIGDGTLTSPEITNTDQAIIKTWNEYFISRGYSISVGKSEQRCRVYRVTNGGKTSPVRTFFLSHSEKRIKKNYLINSRENRLKLLAGIIDTDGWAASTGFELATKSFALSGDYCYLIRSLGFSATIRKSRKRIRSINFQGNYYTVTIYGIGLEKIPTLVKRAKPRKKQYDATNRGFKVEDIGEGEYFGFTLNGNGRFLLGDFTVTHNTYTATVKFFLRWLEDPANTAVKVVSTTAGHARCFGEGTQIRMSDGSIKRIEQIRNADLVMGVDSLPRKVLSTHSGVDQLFYVKPIRTHGFTCNGDHILHLEQTINDLSRWKYLGGKKQISVSEYNQKSPTFKREYKMVRQGYELPKIKQEFDPYIVGLWLGDGHRSQSAITVADRELSDTWCDYFTQKGYKISVYLKAANKASTFNATTHGIGGRGTHNNAFLNFIRTELLTDERQKRIPKCILRSSKEDRWRCLAGIIDSDGSENQGGYIVNTIFPALRDGILDLCASLGLHASAKVYVSKDNRGRPRNIAWSIRIRGRCDLVPVLLPRKKCHKTYIRQIYVPFRVSSLHRGKFFGIETDGDHLFLLANGLVVHNSNAFAGFKRLHTEASFKLPGILRYDFIGLNTDARYASIEQVAIKPGDDGRAALRGFHPIPRKNPHPKFGDLSVVILMLDEADDVPSGAWTGVDNIVSGQTAGGNVSVYAATNPIKPSSEFAKRATPLKGWEIVDENHTMEWEGREGWHVIRLDARQSENYKQRKEVFKGLMTWEAAKGYESKGMNHPDYQTFVLGLYPKQSSMFYICPPYLLDGAVGTYHFVRAPFDIAVEDPAFAEGGDRAIFTSARYGLVDGWTDAEGKFHEMTRRWCIQLDQQFDMPKKNTLEMGDDVIELCKKLHVRPEWFATDATGMGHGLADYLLRRFGDVLAIQWGEGATEHKILEEDTELAIDRYDGLISEMWFAFARWLEFGYVKISPMVQTRELFHELSTRLYRQVSKTKSRANSKQEYKSVNSGRSPDHADSAIMVVHLVRMRGQDRAAMLPEHQEYQEEKAIDIFSPFDEFRKKPVGVSDMQIDFISDSDLLQ
jgi:intein/homing endonuclease